MSTLDDLFPDAKQRRAERAVVDDDHAARSLQQMFGDPRTDLDLTHRASGRRQLVALVDAAVTDARPLKTPPPAPLQDRRRTRRRVDLLTVATGALAVLALVTTGVVGGLQAATASPAHDALRALVADEKTIATMEQRLAASAAAIEEGISAADAQGEALRTTLEGLRTVPDPADIPPGETEAPEDAGTLTIAEDAALTGILEGLKAYRAELDAVERVALPAAYTRGDVDEGLLTEVGSAIDAAQLHLTILDEARTAVRTVEEAIRTKQAAFEGSLTAFAATFTTVAQHAIAENPDADQELKDAVAAAAQALTQVDLMTAEGLAALHSYRDAVFALASDQVRADREREERERAEQERRDRERARPQPHPGPDPDPNPEESSPPTAEPSAPPSEGDGSDPVPEG